VKRVFVIPGRYVDSVTLMGLAEKVMKREGVYGAESGMGTSANITLLAELGYDVPGGAGRNDLLIAVDAADEAGLREARRLAMDLLERRGGRQGRTIRDLSELKPGEYDLAQISLPGEYAAAEIQKALRLDMDVFVFSDHVSLEEELECKRLGLERGRLVMGPDAGVGLIGGVALAAGSRVRPGGVGIVAASGSGAQEVACLVERLGGGVSAIIGTGGRDLWPEIGGITMSMGMDRLAGDPGTLVICLVSKQADKAVTEKMLSEADRLEKPVVAVFLGGGENLFDGHRVQGAFTLQEAAEKCAACLGGSPGRLGWTDGESLEAAQRLMARVPSGRRFLRALYCGGTFAEEALILLNRENPAISLYSNLDTAYARKLDDDRQSRGHTVLDMGTEAFTAEAPHPVFDPAQRLRRLAAELRDPEVAAVMLDFITGPGVHPNPIEPFAPLCAARPDIVFIAAICGAEADPQDIAAGRAALESAGVVVADSNAQSAKLAAKLMAALDGRENHG